MNAPTIAASTQPFSKWFEVHAALGISMMDHLFNRLDGAYPHKWRSNFPNQQAIDNWAESWAEEFEDSGITPGDVKVGIKACRTRYDWPPSCAEFIKACRPSIDSLVAYYEAVAGVTERAKGNMGDWSHPAVFWASITLAYDLQNQTYSQLKTRWERALAEQMERGEWAPIPESVLALPAPDRSKNAKENAAKMMQDLGASDVLTPRSEHTSWYRDILARFERGEILGRAQLWFAIEAARNHGYPLPRGLQ